MRFKNRLAGNSYGYRDLVMNIKLRDSDHVGELQLHLKLQLQIQLEISLKI